MADTTRSLAALQTLLADNVAGDISAQDARDFLVSAYKPQAIIPGGRLTLTTAVPVTTSDVTGATSIYYTPYLHNGIGLYDGTSWTLFTFSELTLALGTITDAKNYDVFLYDNSGTLTLESLAWTNDTTRATALVLQDGVWCKTGALTRRYLGTFRTTSTTTTEDSGGGTTTQVGGKRFLWNAYNRVARLVAVKDTADSWTYGTNAWRQTNAAAGNKVELVCGLNVSIVTAQAVILANRTGGSEVAGGVGIDSTTVNSALAYGSLAVDWAQAIGVYRGYPGLGYHALNWIENVDGGSTVTFFGDRGGTTVQSGLVVEVWA